MTQYGQYADGMTGGGAGGGNGHGGAGGGGIRLLAVPGAFLKQMIWALPLILVLVLLSLWFTRDIKRQYIADGRLLVEYVYNPVSGSANFNSPLSITTDHVTLTEIGIIKNSAIIDEVIHKMISSTTNSGVGGENFAPKLYPKWVEAKRKADRASVGNKRELTAEATDRWNDLVKMVDTSYAVTPSPKSSIIDLTYKHPDPIVAVKTLDAFMTAYANFRKEKFVIRKKGDLSMRRASTQEQLAAIEAKIQNVLNKNGISDFTTEQVGARTRAELLRTQLNTLRGSLAAAEAALAASEDQLRQEPKTITLFTDDRGRQRLAQAQLEKRQLLAKYLPTSNPVRAKQAEIRELQAQIDSNDGKPMGGRRVGPNTVYQALLTQRNTFQSTADSLREQEVILQKQVNAAIAKVTRMRKLGPAYANLVREKTIIETRLAGLQARENAALVDEQQLEDSSQNIKEITRPSTARKGRNMKKILRALAFMGSVFSVFMLALLRVFLDPKLYGPRPQSRMRQAHDPMPEQGYYDDIPEAVPSHPGHMPEEYPVPAYAPAAASASGAAYAPAASGASGASAAYGDIGGSYDQAGYDQAAYAPSPYGEPAPAEYVQPNHEQVYADGSIVGGSVAGGNPYSTPAQPTQQAPLVADGLVGGQIQYAGPDGNIPVLGQAGGASEPKPY